MVRYYGLYANAHRGKVKRASLVPLVVRLAEEEPKPVPSKGWAEMIRKVYEVDPRPGVSFFARGNAYSMLDEKDCLLARKIKFLYIMEMHPKAEESRT
jgi:hypothetical protein